MAVSAPERAGEPQLRPVGIAVIGGGSIGISWSIVFARVGHRVSLYEPDPARRFAAGSEIWEKLGALARAQLLRESPETIAGRIAVEGDLEAAVAQAAHVQECVPEDLKVKQGVLRAVAEKAPSDCVLASSSSALMPTALFDQLSCRERTLIVHPANPPHLLPVVELVPAPFTDVQVLQRTELLLKAAGMSPVRIAREIEGFVLNRLQGAVLREAYALVRDGVTDVDGIDRIMRDGIGRRWAIVGPFETSDLNTRGGLAAHAERMGAAYARMGRERGQDDPWTPELVAAVVAQRRARLPLDRWEERVAWRDRQLIAQERVRRSIGE